MNINYKTKREKHHLVLNSNEEFIIKLSTKKESFLNLFAGRELKIRKNYTLSDQVWEIAYRCAGNEVAIKSVAEPHSIKYLSKKLVKLFSADQILPENKSLLEKCMQQSFTFQRITEEIDSPITADDLITIRKEIKAQQNYKIKALEASMNVCLQNDNLDGVHECQYEMLRVDPSQPCTFDIVFTLLGNPQFGLPKDIFALLQDKIDFIEILNKLVTHPWLWINIHGKPKMLTNEQWIGLLKSENTLADLECLTLQTLITVSELHHHNFFNDASMPKWNVLHQRLSNINKMEWGIIKYRLKLIFDLVLPINVTNESDANKFIEKCLLASNPLHPDGRPKLVGHQAEITEQAQKKRIAATIDFLWDLKQYHDSTKTDERSSVKKILQDAVAVAMAGGTQCPDNAVVYLTELENYIKLHENPECLPNIMVQIFKFEAIKVLVELGENEGTETYLSYVLKFNKILGLGLRKDAIMLHEDMAKTVPLELTLETLSKVFTVENLIEFTIQQRTFIKKFEFEKDSARKAKEIQFGEAFEALQELEERTKERDDQQAIVDTLEAELKNVETSFYKAKARQLFLEAGFLSVRN